MLNYPQAIMAALTKLPPQLQLRLMQLYSTVSSPEELTAALEKDSELRTALNSILQKRQGHRPSHVNELQSILHELDQPAQAMDIPRRIQICEQALALVNRDQQPKLWAMLCIQLGNNLADNEQGDRSENIDKSITAYQDALKIYDRDTMPVEWARTKMNLSRVHCERIKGERTENIEQAIRANEDALLILNSKTTPPEWAMATMELARLYYLRLEGERRENLEVVIKAYEDVLNIMPFNAMPAEWAIATTNLAITYSERIQGDQANNIEKAIQIYEDALLLIFPYTMPTQWAEIARNLAGSYYNRMMDDRADNMDKAIHYYQKALQVLSYDFTPVEWAKVNWNIGDVYFNRIKGNKGQNIEDAISAYQNALRVMTRDTMPIEWAEVSMSLAIAYTNRIREGKSENIEQAIAIYRDILQTYTYETMPIKWAQATMNLANTYKQRIEGDKAENIEQAIIAYENASQTIPQDTMLAEWTKATMNLASAYRDRIQENRDKNIEQSIALYNEILQAITREDIPIEWAQVTMNLAIAYSARSIKDKSANLEQAIKGFEDALVVMTREAMPIEWAQATTNLAIAYSKRRRGDRAANIERAIKEFEDALVVMTREAMPIEWAQATTNLAVLYSNRRRGDKAANTAQAIKGFENILEVITQDAMPIEWAQATTNLANAYYLTRWNKAENVERAIIGFKDALSVMTRDAMPSEYRSIQQNLGKIFWDRAEWPDVAHTFAEALKANDDLYEIAALPEARQIVLRQVKYILEGLAYALVRIGKIDNVQNAVLTLEINRARWLREHLDLRGYKPDEVSQTLWQQFMVQGEMIRHLQSESQLPDDSPKKRDFLTLSSLLQEARQQLVPLVDAIRQVDPDFLPKPTFAEIQTVSQQIPLVYLFTTSVGSAALIIQKNQVTPLLLGGFIRGSLTTLLDVTFSTPHRQRTELNRLLEILGNGLMGPVAEVLREVLEINTKIILIPVGELAVLPLHAASYTLPASNGSDGTEVHTRFMDEFTVHYAPSARSVARSLEQRSARANRTEKLAGVGNPLAQPGQPSFTNLPDAKKEMEVISGLLPSQQVGVLYEDQATQTRLLENLADATLLHLACHGTFNPEDVLDSGLLLADGLLSLRTLLDPDFRGLDQIRLVTLSACQTAITDFQNVPNEVMGLPAGFLQAGVPGVVGTLWPVVDGATSLLMSRFYENYLKREMEPAQALRDAQQWLRDLDFSDDDDEPERPYADPYYWAGFTFHGV